MKALIVSLFALAFATLAPGAEARSASSALQGHISKLSNALAAYSSATRENGGQIEHSRQAVAVALKDWKAIHLRLVRQLIDENPHDASEEVYRMRTATALCLAAEGLKDSDCEVFRTDSAIEADWLYVRALIDYGNSFTFGTNKPAMRMGAEPSPPSHPPSSGRG